jgi:hypothetical protein
MSTIEAHGGDEDCQEDGLEDDDPAGNAQLFEDKSGDGIAFSLKVMGTHHQVGGMCVEQVQSDKPAKQAPKESPSQEQFCDDDHMISHFSF